MIPAVIYARYSSDKQRAESIQQQVDACSAYAEREGYFVSRIYSDEAVSGRSDRRDAFLQMVDDARLGSFEAVLVYKLDRFARNRYDAAMYRKRLRDSGVRVVSATECIPDTPEGRLMEAMMEGVAEWYSADLAQKVRRGMYANAEKCLANGQAVFGYATAADGRYAIDEDAASVVRRVFERWSAGEDAGSIAESLADRCVRTQVGGRPSAAWIRRVVRDERYLGVYKWGDVRVEGGMPRIVDDALWERAQSRRRASDSTRRRHAYPLAGRLVDAESGRLMCGVSAKGRGGREYAYYAVKIGGKVGGRVRCELVEDAAVRAIADVFKDAAAVDDVIEQVASSFGRLADSERLDAAKKRLRELKAEEGRIVDAIARGVELEGLLERARQLAREVRIAELDVEDAEPEELDLPVVRDVVGDLLSYASPEAILEHMADSVVLYRDEGIVVVTLPIRKNTTTDCYENSRSMAVLERSEWWTGGVFVLNGHLAVGARLCA